MKKLLFTLMAFILQYPTLWAYDLISPLSKVDSEITLPFQDAVNTIEPLGYVISYMIGIAGILGVIGVTWGGVQMVFAVGEEEKIKKGRYTIIYSLIGVLVAGLAYGVVSIVSNIRIS